MHKTCQHLLQGQQPQQLALTFQSYKYNPLSKNQIHTMKADLIISLATLRHRMTIVTTAEGHQKGTQWF